MIKNFEKELNLISSNSQISEKLMFFSLYNEFYNNLMEDLDDSSILMLYYSSIMEKTLELAVAELKLQENISVDAKQLMEIYLKRLKPKIPSYIIIPFERELNSLIDANGYVNIIEKFDSIPLDTKVNIMVNYREYINSMYLTITKLCGEENSNELSNNLLEMLPIKLEEYLNDSLNKGIDSLNQIDNLKATLVVNTKDYLMNKLKNNEFGLNNIQDEIANHICANFNEKEQKILLMGLIYAIAGYNENDKSKEEEQIKEMCEMLKISKEKYIRTTFSIEIRILKIMTKLKNENESEDLFGNPPKKIK